MFLKERVLTVRLGAVLRGPWVHGAKASYIYKVYLSVLRVFKSY